MAESAPRRIKVLWIERILAAAALLICLAANALVWQDISRQQPVWPLPGIYLVEVILVCAGGTYAIYHAGQHDGQQILWLAWAACGWVLGLALVSPWSFGLFYVPVWAVLVAACVIATRRQHTPLPGLFALSLAAALLQAGLILWVASQGFW